MRDGVEESNREQLTRWLESERAMVCGRPSYWSVRRSKSIRRREGAGRCGLAHVLLVITLSVGDVLSWRESNTEREVRNRSGSGAMAPKWGCARRDVSRPLLLGVVAIWDDSVARLIQPGVFWLLPCTRSPEAARGSVLLFACTGIGKRFRRYERELYPGYWSPGQGRAP